MSQPADRHLERVVRRTIWIAGLNGQDYTAQNSLAVRTLRRLRPEMTATEALDMVDLVRQRNMDLGGPRDTEPA